MGVVRFAIHLVAIPIILVSLAVFAVFLLVFLRQRKKQARDLEQQQQAEHLPPFVFDQQAQTQTPPPDYSNNYYPMKPPVAMA
ncbi:hypothetical protein L249_5215 [Ophiocordyceps polyrhachis-furcata BCC 54312]|uniref:Uncharacterized protein n=1 Tax=Ophiocordyceps polyrhachis-furcata BCC 54312 TaxID=1330021 RepID=A0A367L9G1_9HYPO|nr:hypothetical protein L249_5215 [Ophiocordyceps polyrhachis-furcata BCC 54312]